MKDHAGNYVRCVWVLGAGFSVSLGGPLLPDLLRLQNIRDLAARYPATLYADLAEISWSIQALFIHGRDTEHLWHDAEAFLDFVDCAVGGSDAEATLLRMCSEAGVKVGPVGSLTSFRPITKVATLDEIKSGAIRAVAAECSHFVTEHSRRPERWTPYREWMRALAPAFDTIVTFNYDNVIEQLPNSTDALDVVLPHRAASPYSEGVRLLKLHGSVDWLSDNGRCRRVPVSDVLHGGNGGFAIATPGRSKRDMKDNLFEPLWSAAEEALRQAEAIVFLGYRFPESDGDARRRLLHAIKDNGNPKLCVQTVLGHNTMSADSVRLRRLIQVSARRTREVLLDPTTHVSASSSKKTLELLSEPLYAQDFLALFAEDGPLSTLP